MQNFRILRLTNIQPTTSQLIDAATGGGIQYGDPFSTYQSARSILGGSVPAEKGSDQPVVSDTETEEALGNLVRAADDRISNTISLGDKWLASLINRFANWLSPGDAPRAASTGLIQGLSDDLITRRK